MKKSFQRVWEQASIYLPVLLMAMLALGTWWLVRNAPKPLAGTSAQVVSADPDYAMQQFSVRQFDAQGRMQSIITGEEARHFPLTDILEVDQVRTRSIAPDGAVTTTSGKRGISNSDGSEVQLWGDAKVMRVMPHRPQDVLRVEGEFLHAWTNEERVQSHLPVVVQRGNNQFKGDRLDYNNLSQVVELKGRVHGVINPR
jgi:lipopolysaccharide export system protein LptC